MDRPLGTHIPEVFSELCVLRSNFGFSSTVLRIEFPPQLPLCMTTLESR